MMLMGGVEIRAEDKKADEPTTYKAKANPVPCGVIGCGTWGRELLTTLALLENGPVAGICDTYSAFVRRAQKLAPKAEAYDDYKKLLANEDVKAIIVATPSHLHREIVIAALEAGKHVYCEAPMATTLEDARAIAAAAKKNPQSWFQVGLQARCDKQIRYLEQFIRTGANGNPVKFRSQWNKKESWQRTSPNPQRQEEMNWRLDSKVSLGLTGEIGVHHIDLASWFLMGRPIAVHGLGSIVLWRDGRKVPDSVDVIFEYPNGVRMVFASSLATSFDSEYYLLHGTFATIMGRDRRAWMFKEVDSPLLGWEVYARKESFYKETGIVLGANATKLAAQGDKPQQDASVVDEKTPLQYALEAFLINSDIISRGLEDFSSLFDKSDKAALKEYLVGLQKNLVPAAGFEIGYESAVNVIKAHEAITKGGRIEIDPALYAI